MADMRRNAVIVAASIGLAVDDHVAFDDDAMLEPRMLVRGQHAAGRAAQQERIVVPQPLDLDVARKFPPPVFAPDVDEAACLHRVDRPHDPTPQSNRDKDLYLAHGRIAVARAEPTADRVLDRMKRFGS